MEFEIILVLITFAWWFFVYKEMAARNFKITPMILLILGTCFVQFLLIVNLVSKMLEHAV